MVIGPAEGKVAASPRARAPLARRRRVAKLEDLLLHQPREDVRVVA